eukprot:CAMPEP_0171095952 /NCGR_PEP_ID=MMETSP0766_2-20121228/43467_1 /TAXON_ID=439317 /ORGANISM="Gambierdiscus australes, Strain CAWD 149" /LENGTH=156 /DNA_ID=CAMNT_0011554829 /DNA_START=173 /DNA_END=643 /DNA_ORIENTATION=+
MKTRIMLSSLPGSPLRAECQRVCNKNTASWLRTRIAPLMPRQSEPPLPNAAAFGLSWWLWLSAWKLPAVCVCKVARKRLGKNTVSGSTLTVQSCHRKTPSWKIWAQTWWKIFEFSAVPYSGSRSTSIDPCTAAPVDERLKPFAKEAPRSSSAETLL